MKSLRFGVSGFFFVKSLKSSKDYIRFIILQELQRQIIAENLEKNTCKFSRFSENDCLKILEKRKMKSVEVWSFRILQIFSTFGNL